MEEAWEEYETQKADALTELDEAQDKIDEARAEVEEIEDQEWYVNDRDVLAEYTSYGENADRMRAIGEVFPELFFPCGGLDQSYNDDKDGGGRAYSDRYIESAWLWERCDCRKISDVRISCYDGRKYLRGSDWRKDFPVHHHIFLSNHVYTSSAY